MKKTIKKSINEQYAQFQEDMQELQRLMSRQSVYASARIRTDTRKPKHVKRYYEWQDW